LPCFSFSSLCLFSSSGYVPVCVHQLLSSKCLLRSTVLCVHNELTVVGLQDEKLREQCLKLCLACLSYDFFGTSSDETTEDVGTVQVSFGSVSCSLLSILSL
jgi:hypothetical protein